MCVLVSLTFLGKELYLIYNVSDEGASTAYNRIYSKIQTEYDIQFLLLINLEVALLFYYDS